MKENEDLDSRSACANIVFNVFLCFTAIMLNSITIHAIRNTSSLANPLRTLLLYLAVSDLSVGLLVHPLYIANLALVLNHHTKNNATAAAFDVITNFLGYISFFGVMALTADRFLAIHLHLRYQELVTRKRVNAVVVAVALVVALSAFAVHVCIGYWVSVDIAKLIYLPVDIFCLVVNTVLYYKIYLTVRRHKNQIQSLQVQQNEQNAEITSLNIARGIKLAVATYYVCLVYLVCYLPRTCLEIAVFISGPNTTTERLTDYFWTMVLLNSSLNPLIYCWKMRHIRHAVLKILQNIFFRVTINTFPPGV